MDEQHERHYLEEGVAMKVEFPLAVCLMLTGSGPILAADAGSAEWGPTNCGVQLSVKFTLPVARQEAAERVEFSLRVKNVTSETIVLLETVPVQDYSFSITNSSGVAVRPKLTRSEGQRELTRSVHKVKPAEVYETKVKLADIYGPLSPGRYTFVARGVIWQRPGQPCEVISNVLSFHWPG